jgi:hypothetical protein
MCETIGGGTLVVMDGPGGGNTTECKSGTGDGDYCFNTPTSIECHPGDHQSANKPRHGSMYVDDSITGQMLPVEADPAGAPVIDATGTATGDPVVANPEQSISRVDEVNESVPDTVAGEPATADPSAADGGAIESDDGNLYFEIDEQ